MSRRKINKQFASLQSRIQHFNQDIQKCNDLDFYRVVDYMIEFAEINKYLTDYYNKNGYPDTLKNSNDLEDPVVYIGYFITSYGEVAHSCWVELMEMWQLHSERNPFVQQTEVQQFFRNLMNLAFYGTYNIPESPDLAEFKRKLLCRSIDLAFAVWLDKRENQLDLVNVDGYEKLENLREDYKDYQLCMGSPITILNYDGYNGVWKGPELGLQIEQILDSAENYYGKKAVYQIQM